MSDAYSRSASREQIGDYTFVLWVILSAVFAYLFMQWIAEFLLRPRFGIRDMLILTAYVASAICLLYFWLSRL